MFQPKSSSSHVARQLHNSLGDYARELFKPSKDLASLQVCNEKNGFGFQIIKMQKLQKSQDAQSLLVLI